MNNNASENIIVTSNNMNSMEPPIAEKHIKFLSLPILLGIGLLGGVFMLFLLATTLSPKSIPVTPSPMPTPRIISTATPTVAAPTRKVSTDSAIQAIFDAESSASSALKNTDFNEQKLIPPQLDMLISF